MCSARKYPNPHQGMLMRVPKEFRGDFKSQNVLQKYELQAELEFPRGGRGVN